MTAVLQKLRVEYADMCAEEAIFLLDNGTKEEVREVLLELKSATSELKRAFDTRGLGQKKYDKDDKQESGKKKHDKDEKESGKHPDQKLQSEADAKDSDKKEVKNQIGDGGGAA